MCAAEADAEDVHTVHCGIGGGTAHRHDAAARILADISRSTAGVGARFGQHVQRLDIVRALYWPMYDVGDNGVAALVLILFCVVTGLAFMQHSACFVLALCRHRPG